MLVLRPFTFCIVVQYLTTTLPSLPPPPSKKQKNTNNIKNKDKLEE